MEMEKKETISVLVATVVERKKYCIKNMNLLHSKYHWQNWVDWISAKQQKILRPEKDTFSVKEPES